jgi:hypothetical protein
MSQLMARRPYGPRDQALFLEEANKLTLHHLAGCAAYTRIWPDWKPARSVEELPYLHVGVFKHVDLKTAAPNLRHERVLRSSATSGGSTSRIALDSLSSRLQSQSTSSILKDFLGSIHCPLLVLDSSKSLRQPGAVSARVAAALSLRSFASDMCFLLDDSENPSSVNWQRAECYLQKHDELLVYGFTSMLWLVWGAQEKPEAIQKLLSGKRIYFVHSGGWKRMERLNVTREQFDSVLLRNLAHGSRVLDFYGLVEQVGVIYPLCESGFRHVPLWADVIVRDAFSLRPLAAGADGLLQLVNTLAWGAPYHSVLTDDVGRLVPGTCPCGRSEPRFELLGRVPNAEPRGCANV